MAQTRGHSSTWISREGSHANSRTLTCRSTARSYATAAKGNLGQIKTVIGAVVDVSVSPLSRPLTALRPRFSRPSRFANAGASGTRPNALWAGIDMQIGCNVLFLLVDDTFGYIFILSWCPSLPIHLTDPRPAPLENRSSSTLMTCPPSSTPSRFRAPSLVSFSRFRCTWERTLSAPSPWTVSFGKPSIERAY